MEPVRVLFLCTHNANRSQMAEAIFAEKIARLPASRFEVASAGSEPADQVSPWALRTLRAKGIDWSGRRPKSVDAVIKQHWDLVITVCDNAKESCPIIPGEGARAHWGMDDPSEGNEADRHRAYNETFMLLSRRIDHLLALPFRNMSKHGLELSVKRIAKEVPAPRAARN